jgi:TPP-dependent 2-oxoacid decarboxylase
MNYGKSYKVTTKGELDAAFAHAVKETDTMHLIEVIIPRDDCSRPLRRMASKLGELRDTSKRK